jgi:N-acetylglutamate synthase-like GNAT family acetyltransferase
MEFRTRAATIDDLDSIVYLSEHWGHPSTPEKMRSHVQEILNHADHRVFLIQNEERITGWIHGVYLIHMESGPFVEITGLVVDLNFRRIGMGRILVEKMIDWSGSMNCKKVRVRSNIQREEAHPFYLSIGFKEVKQQKVYDFTSS